jgi:diguanylate cyclase (GGDEF)-like protein
MSLAAIRQTFQIPKESPDLMRSQLYAFSNQVPLLYFIVIVNGGALAWTYYGLAPVLLTIVVPAALATACLVRIGMWIRTRRVALSDAEVARRLRTTVWLAGTLGAIFAAWSLSLYPYGDAYAQGHIAFCLGLTVISCIFCLMHLRAAALVLTGIVVTTFSVFFLWTGRPAFIAIALNMVLVAAAMVYILLTYSRDFANMIVYQKKLVETHKAEAERVRRVAEAEIAAQREILKHAERFEVALNNMLHGLCMFDADDRLIVCNERYAKMYALPHALIQPGARWSDIVAHRLDTFGYRHLTYADVLAQRSAVDFRVRDSVSTRELGDGRTILIRHQPIKEGGWVATHEDITERHRTEERLSYMARHDALTGLPNRVLLQERLEEAIAGLEGGGEFAVLCLDLDHFKDANDALGHAVGDALLREVSGRLTRAARPGDTVARIGGDEFAIIHVGSADTGELAALAQQLLDVLTKPYDVDGHQINVGASAGMARAPYDESAAAPLLRLADIALYRAKSEGRRIFRFFEPAMDSELQFRRRLEIDLRRALIDGEFEMYYQPINDAATGVIRCFEALLRWRHPERGMIAPTEFIALAERTGLIVPLGEWALRTACTEAMRWPSEVRVSVNLSACQFKAANLTQTIRQALDESGLSAQRLELEITESVLLDGNSNNVAILHELRNLGVRIAMDDFGTGYSSLSYLRSFPFDKIKIDQSFVKNIDERDAREIVRTIASLGQTLGVTTTAEGVETAGQLAKMIEYRCVEVQGYHFSRAVPAAMVAGLLARFNEARMVA